MTLTVNQLVQVITVAGCLLHAITVVSQQQSGGIMHLDCNYPRFICCINSANANVLP